MCKMFEKLSGPQRKQKDKTSIRYDPNKARLNLLLSKTPWGVAGENNVRERKVEKVEWSSKDRKSQAKVQRSEGVTCKLLRLSVALALESS